MALRDMTRLVCAYQSMRPIGPARSELGNQEPRCNSVKAHNLFLVIIKKEKAKPCGDAEGETLPAQRDQP